jgi:hypothetical protein
LGQKGKTGEGEGKREDFALEKLMDSMLILLSKSLRVKSLQII